MKRKDITIGMEIGVCDNLRPDSTGNRRWSKGIVTAVTRIPDGTYEVLYETLGGKPRSTTLSRVKPWTEAKEENEASRVHRRAQRAAHDQAGREAEAKLMAYRQVRETHRKTLLAMAQAGTKLDLWDHGRATLTITDPAQLERILTALSKEVP